MSKKPKTETTDLYAELDRIGSFRECLRAWCEAQTLAIDAKHAADLAYAHGYSEAANTERVVGGKPKALTEKEKDNAAFLASADVARHAADCDLVAKSFYNLMLHLRDNDADRRVVDSAERIIAAVRGL